MKEFLDDFTALFEHDFFVPGGPFTAPSREQPIYQTRTLETAKKEYTEDL